MKLIRGEEAIEGDPEFGISRGRLLPSHHIFSTEEASLATRQELEDSLVLVHGGAALRADHKCDLLVVRAEA